MGKIYYDQVYNYRVVSCRLEYMRGDHFFYTINVYQ